jgi:hypothetical protein
MLNKLENDCSSIKYDVLFCRPEVLVLENLRLWSQTPGTYQYIQKNLRQELGEGPGLRVAKAIKMMSHVLGVHARRTIYLKVPGSSGATNDERALLTIMGCLLNSRRSQATAIATWLLPYNCHGTFLAVAGELARALKDGGHEVAKPRAVIAPRVQAVTLKRVA